MQSFHVESSANLFALCPVYHQYIKNGPSVPSWSFCLLQRPGQFLFYACTLEYIAKLRGVRVQAAPKAFARVQRTCR